MIVRSIPAESLPAVFRAASPTPRPRKAARALLGQALPRIAPPLPARSEWEAFRDLATRLGYTLHPWQETAARYLTAKGADGRLLYPEVAVIVGRQNGKTTLLLPLIVGRLLAGQRVMHTAQNRSLPRDFFEQELAPLMEDRFRSELRSRRGVSYGAGMEKITLRNGGIYRIVAPTRGGARGPANDLVIIDELREMEDTDFIGAAEPTLSASPNPQIVYLSNMGTEMSVILNGLQERADKDRALAYLEWSASPDRDAGDVKGWLEANPSVGYLPGKMEYLARKYNSYRLEGNLALWETEHLCRKIPSMRTVALDPATWKSCQAKLEKPSRPAMAISMDPSGTRASAAMAWKQTDGTTALRMIADVAGPHLDAAALGKTWSEIANRHGATVGFDPWTDGVTARQFRTTKSINGQDYANASVVFTQLAEDHKLRWDDCDAVTDDLTWTARKPHESGAWMTIKAKEDRPIPAVFAAIRAVWLVAGPRPTRATVL